MTHAQNSPQVKSSLEAALEKLKARVEAAPSAGAPPPSPIPAKPSATYERAAAPPPRIERARPEHRQSGVRHVQAAFLRVARKLRAKRPPSDRVKLRRRWDTTGHLPADLREHFSHGQKVIIEAIRSDMKKLGRCTRSIAELCRISGMSRTWVKATKRIAQALGLFTCRVRPICYKLNRTTVLEKPLARWLQWTTYKGGTKATGKELYEPSFFRPRPGAAHQPGDVNPLFCP